MTLSTRKASIASQFDKAAFYDQQALVQKECAALVAQQAATLFSAPSAQQILELGCGTGFLSAHLAQIFPNASLCLTDLSPAMLERVQARLCPQSEGPSQLAPSSKRFQFRVMDGERPETDLLPAFDLIISSLCIQWFENRPEALQRLCALLKPGGFFIAATLLQNSLQEWRASCLATHTPCGLPDWPTASTLQNEWPGMGEGRWENVSLSEKRASGQDFLRGLRGIGAALPKHGHQPATPGALRRALKHFDTHYTSVTYQIGLGIFRRSL